MMNGGDATGAIMMKNIGEEIANNLVADCTLGRVITLAPFIEPGWDFTVRCNVFALDGNVMRYDTSPQTFSGMAGPLGNLPAEVKKGIREVAEINWDRANYLRGKIAGLKGYEVDLESTIFNEFRVKAKKSFGKIEEKCMAHGVFPGVALEPYYPELKDQFLVCATETKSKEDLDRFVEVLAQC